MKKPYFPNQAVITLISAALLFAAPSVAQNADSKDSGLTPPPADVQHPRENQAPMDMPQPSPAPLPPPVEVPVIIASSTRSSGEAVKIEDAGQKEKRISLDLKGIDITELLRIFSMKMGLSIVPSKSVGGRVSIFLNNLSFDDALDIVLISQDLAAVRMGKIINIMTAAEYEKAYGRKYNEKRMFTSLKLTYAKPSTIFNVLTQLKSDIGKIIVDESSGTILLIDIPEKIELMKDAVKELDQPLATEIFDIKYAKPADMKNQLSSAITTGPGELFVDERSSKVAVSDLPEKMSKIRRIMKAFDSAPQQVFIEAEIIELTLNKKFERGIEWDKFFNDEQWVKWAKLMGLSLTGTYPLTALSAAGAITTTVKVGQNVSNPPYTAVIKFLETYGDTKVLSRPRIAVISNQEARIMVGTREVYATASQSQSSSGPTITADTVQFIDVGVKLNVVPTINTDGFITMKIKPEISSVTGTFTTTTGTKVPVVSTSEAETIVKIKDGTMIMIGGLMKDTKTDDVKGIPLLAKIPWIGGIFSNRTAETKRQEIIIFLTPHIITGETLVPGTEPEKLFPPDMVTKEIREKLVGRKVDEIAPQGLGGESGKFEKKAFQKDVPETNIETRMKGLKRY